MSTQSYSDYSYNRSPSENILPARVHGFSLEDDMNLAYYTSSSCNAMDTVPVNAYEFYPDVPNLWTDKKSQNNRIILRREGYKGAKAETFHMINKKEFSVICENIRELLDEKSELTEREHSIMLFINRIYDIDTTNNQDVLLIA